MGFFSKIKQGLQKTRDSIANGVNSVINSFTKIDEELFEELEETLVMSDIGVNTAGEICEKLRHKIKETGVTDPNEIKGMLKEIIAEMLGENEGLRLETKPSVILVIGVNGVGKTTSIGKLAAQLKRDGKTVVLGAADTFRAAAIDQLGIWAERAGVAMVKSLEGTDPASVVFDTIASAKSKGADVIICDTAGRLHNKKNLMDELAKIYRVIARELPDASVETLLVLDAATGQNAVNQAREFSNVANITGIILTKLDGTAKGGIIVAIKNELGIPVKYVGVGEGIDDLQPFDPEDFAKAAEPYIREAVKNPAIDVSAVAALLQARCEKLTEIPEKVDFFDQLPDYGVECFTNKKSKTNPEVSQAMLEAAIPALEGIGDWTADAVHDTLIALAEHLGVKNATLMWPVRIAAAGKLVTPGGAVEICHLLGKDETLRRLRLGLDKLN